MKEHMTLCNIGLNKSNIIIFVKNVTTFDATVLKENPTHYVN